MPSTVQLRKRGGLVRVRRVKLPGGKYRDIYVVRKPGPRGGRTLAGETKRSKRG